MMTLQQPSSRGETYLGSHIDTLVGVYRKLSKPYEYYSHENYKKQRIEAVRKEIKNILKTIPK